MNMRLLFVTQKVDADDDVLGVYHQWITGLAPHFEKVSVIALLCGRTSLPKNTLVYSLGKEQLHGRVLTGFRRALQRLHYTFVFYRLVWRLSHEYDAVFVHMNPEYVVLAGWLWRLWGKKVVLWYAHYLPSWRLRLAAIFADQIVTSTRLAYPLESKKLTVLQQGIDTSRFKPAHSKFPVPNSKFRVLFLGRIAPVKNIDVLLKALAIVRQKYPKVSLTIIGAPTPGKLKEAAYYQEIKKLAADLGLSDIADFRLSIPNHQAPEIYNGHDLFVNLTDVGSFDKTTLEAMACGLLVLVSNPAFENIFPQELAKVCMFKEKNGEDLAEKILSILKLSTAERKGIGEKSRQIIVKNHSLDTLINRIVSCLESVTRHAQNKF